MITIIGRKMEETTTSSAESHSFPSESPAAVTPSPPQPSTVTRLWRPAAQRNLRNQWSNLASYRQKWVSLSSTARSHAISLVNACLSQRYMNARELGVLSDMPDIKKKACWKLFKQQDLHRSKILSSYKDMVAIVIHMVSTSTSMRCFLKGTGSSSILQYSSSSANGIDDGDGGGIPVFMFWSISSFEKLGQELIQMFTLELNLKRLLVMELLSISSEEVLQNNGMNWLDELYSGEFDDLSRCNLYSREACEPVHPRLEGRKSDKLILQTKHQPDHDVLQVYLTTWLADVKVDKYRVDEIFASVGEEMQVTLV